MAQGNEEKIEATNTPPLEENSPVPTPSTAPVPPPASQQSDTSSIAPIPATPIKKELPHFAAPTIGESSLPNPEKPTPGLGSLAGRLQSAGGKSSIGVTLPSVPAPAKAPERKSTSSILDELRKQSDDDESVVRPLRTYKDDISDVITRRKTSVVSAVAAEAERRQRHLNEHAPQIAPKKSAVNYILVAGAVFFVLIGVGIVGYAFIFRNKEPTTVNVIALPKLVFSESQSTIDTTRMSRRSLTGALSEKRSENLRLGSIVQFYPTKKNALDKDQILTAAEFLKLAEINPPGTLMRTLQIPMMLGLHAFNGNQYFLIFKVDEYDRAFAGMLEWEPTIEQDLFGVLGIAPLKVIPVPEPTTPVATTTSTTTPASTTTPPNSEPISPITTDDFNRRSFVDIVVKNINARALKREDGTTALLYAFPDKNTLVITSTEPTLTEIITRMQSIRI